MLNSQTFPPRGCFCPHLVFAVVFLFLSLFFWHSLLFDADIGIHVRAGNWILDHHEMPKIEMSTFSPTESEWTVHIWFSEVLMGVAYRFFGMPGITFLFAGLYGVFYALLFWLFRKKGLCDWASFLLVLLCVSASLYNLGARPYLFSWFFILLWIHILENHRTGASWKVLILLPASMMLWVNMHGGWFSGVLILGIYGLVPLLLSGKGEADADICQRRFKELFFCGIFCMLAACANPYGYKIFIFVFKVLTESYWVNNITEYASPDFHNPYQKLSLIYLAFVFFVFLSCGKKFAWEIVGLLVLHLYMGLYSLRAFPLFIIVSAPFAAECFSGFVLADTKFSSEKDSILWYRPAISILSVLIVLGVYKTSLVTPDFNKTPHPGFAAEFLFEKRPNARLFSSIQYGSYIVYRGWPDAKVFIDGRVDAYGEKRFNDLIRVERMRPGWKEALDEYDIDSIMYPTNSVFAWRLKNEHNDTWTEVFSDNTATVFFRR